MAVQIYNNNGAGGIHRKPARFEIDGQNKGMLLPYQFIKSKYNPYFFWSWGSFDRKTAPRIWRKGSRYFFIRKLSF